MSLQLLRPVPGVAPGRSPTGEESGARLLAVTDLTDTDKALPGVDVGGTKRPIWLGLGDRDVARGVAERILERTLFATTK